jgi:hypothetical protein
MADEKPAEKPPEQTQVIPLSPPTPKPGTPGQPSLAEWEKEIRADLAVAMGKIAQLPDQALPHLQRIKRLIEANLG